MILDFTVTAEIQLKWTESMYCVRVFRGESIGVEFGEQVRIELVRNKRMRLELEIQHDLTCGQVVGLGEDVWASV
jgi:hypothetical protein